MFLTLEDHFAYLEKCVAARPKHVALASYGIYAGITYAGSDTKEWGEKYTLMSRKFLDALAATSASVKVLIGASEYRSCRGQLPCLDCEAQYARSLVRVIQHAELFPKFEWHITTQLHLKCYLFFYDDSVMGIAGGRNLSDSRWADVTFPLTVKEIKPLYEHFDGLWRSALLATDDAVGALLRRQGISDEAMQRL